MRDGFPSRASSGAALFAALLLVPPASAQPSEKSRKLTADEMEAVLRAHTPDVKARCWASFRDNPPSASETVHVTIDGTGHVVRAVAQGSVKAVGECLEAEMRGWSFPATGATTGPVDFPFKFLSEDGWRAPNGYVPAAAPFDEAAARASLDAIDVERCATPAAPKGVAGSIRVTFAPDGSVYRTALDQAVFWEKGGAGACLEAAFRGARVAAFAGEPVTRGESFVLR